MKSEKEKERKNIKQQTHYFKYVTVTNPKFFQTTSFIDNASIFQW